MPDDLTLAAPRLWTNPRASDGRPTLIRLDREALTLSTVFAADLETVLGDLGRGLPVAGQVVPLSTITRAKGDEVGSRISVTYLAGPSKAETKALEFAETADRDAFVSALAGALGPGWEVRREPVSRWYAALWTLGPTILAALVTWFLHAEATRIAAGLPPLDWGKRPVFRLLGTVVHFAERQLGPTGVLVLGGLAVAAGLVIFGFAMADLPRQIRVEPAGRA